MRRHPFLVTSTVTWTWVVEARDENSARRAVWDLLSTMAPPGFPTPSDPELVDGPEVAWQVAPWDEEDDDSEDDSDSDSDDHHLPTLTDVIRHLPAPFRRRRAS